MDACEIANFLAKELFMHQLASFDGYSSGVGAPTRTTATLTPTTLRNIEETLLGLTSETSNTVPCQAGFVPPLAPSYLSATDPEEQSMDSSSMSNSSWHTTPPPPSTTEDLMYDSSASASQSNGKSESGTTSTTSKPRRNMGGRRPNKASNLSPEEEEKRRVRRERNKLAAARCRRRREDHTNELLGEVEKLEKKRAALQQEVQDLKTEREELQFVLEAHRPVCKRPGPPMSPIDIKPVIASTMLTLADKIKQEPVEMPSFDTDGPPSPKRILLTSAVLNNQQPPIVTVSVPATSNVTTFTHHPNNIMNNNNNTNINNNQIVVVSTNSNSGNHFIANPLPPMTKPNRPNSLNVPLVMTPSQALNSIPINTPSNGMFNFDSLMNGGTGLTPVNHPLIPNGARTPLDLITPTSDASKLCSL